VERRLTDPALQPAELPRLDAVVLSHLHGDHFDRVARSELPKSPPLLTTPQAARKLRRSGFATYGLDTWQQHQLEKDVEFLVVEALPAVHARPDAGTAAAGDGEPADHRRDGAVRRLYTVATP